MGESLTDQKFPIVARQGVDGWVVRLSDKLTEESNRAALALFAALEGGAIDGVDEASSALASVYLRSSGSAEQVEADLKRLLADEDFYTAQLPGGRTHWRIPTVFGGASGPSLDELGGEIGLSREEAIRDLTETRLRVLAIGFAPGQPYLGELPEAWNIPRLPDLIQAPAGALVVAIRQICLFSNDTPTGWQHIGMSAFRTYRPDAENPFPLSPGDEVSFEPVSEEELRNIRSADTTGDGGARTEQLA